MNQDTDFSDTLQGQQMEGVMQDNPLRTNISPTDPTSTTPNSAPVPKKSYFQRLKSDKKTLLLTVAGAWVLFISLVTVITLVIKILQNRTAPIVQPTPIPTPTTSVIINNNNLPEPWKSQLDTLDHKINANEEFLLPDFDLSIGQ